MSADRCETRRGDAPALRTVGIAAELARRDAIFKVRRVVDRGPGKDARLG